jgi:phage-related protein
METFLPPRVPSFGSSKSTEAKILSPKFGDGYSQRTGDGLNAVAQKWSLIWENLSLDQANLIDNFFIARAGVAAFLWTPTNETIERKFICSTWSRIWQTPFTDRMSATVEEVFDL